MLDDHLSSPVTRRRLRSGPAADYVDHFVDWLHCRGYLEAIPELLQLAAERLAHTPLEITP
jgi:hypothetical protein